MDNNPYESTGTPGESRSDSRSARRWPDWLPSLFWFLFVLSAISCLIASTITVVPGTALELAVFAAVPTTGAAALLFGFLAIYGTIQNYRSR